MIQHDKLTYLVAQADKNLRLLIRDKKTITEEEFLSELRKYNLRDALIEIAYMCLNINIKNEITNFRAFSYYDEILNFYYRSDCFAKLAHLLIISGTNDYKNKYLSEKYLPNLILLSNIIGNVLESKIPLCEETLANQICIIFHEQIEYQKSIKTLMYRNYMLFNEKYGKRFHDITKVSIKEYFNIGLFIIMYCTLTKPIFTKKEIINACIRINLPYITKEGVSHVLDYLSINYNDYRIQNDLPKTRNIMPLQYKPIIKTQKNEYILVSRIMFVEKIYNGIFYDIEASYKNINDFRQDFGLVFEKYVGDFIKYYEKEAKIFSEKELSYTKNGDDAVFTDWTVIYGEIAYLIEVKSIILPLKDIYNNSLKDFIKTHLLKAYHQIIEKINDIKLHPEFNSLKNKKIIPIIVFRDTPPMYNKLFKKELDNVIQECINLNKYKWLKDNEDIIDSIYILNIDEFELYWINRKCLNIEKIYKIAQDDIRESFTSLMFKNKDKIWQNDFLYSHYEEIFPEKELLKLNENI